MGRMTNQICNTAVKLIYDEHNSKCTSLKTRNILSGAYHDLRSHHQCISKEIPPANSSSSSANRHLFLGMDTMNHSNNKLAIPHLDPQKERQSSFPGSLHRLLKDSRDSVSSRSTSSNTLRPGTPSTGTFSRGNSSRDSRYQGNDSSKAIVVSSILNGIYRRTAKLQPGNVSTRPLGGSSTHIHNQPGASTSRRPSHPFLMMTIPFLTFHLFSSGRVPRFFRINISFPKSIKESVFHPTQLDIQRIHVYQVWSVFVKSLDGFWLERNLRWRQRYFNRIAGLRINFNFEIISAYCWPRWFRLPRASCCSKHRHFRFIQFTVWSPPFCCPSSWPWRIGFAPKTFRAGPRTLTRCTSIAGSCYFSGRASEVCTAKGKRRSWITS